MSQFMCKRSNWSDKNNVRNHIEKEKKKAKMQKACKKSTALLKSSKTILTQL